MGKKIRKKMNKKGSVIDLVFIAAGLLIFAVVTLFAFKVVVEFNNNIQTNDMVPTETKETTDRLEGTFSGTLDYSFLFLAIGLTIGAFILASLVRVHPIFIVFFFIALIMIIFFAGIFSNIYQEMAETPQLQAQADQLIFISYILKYLPFIVGIFGVLLMIIMYKLYSNAQ